MMNPAPISQKPLAEKTMEEISLYDIKDYHQNRGHRKSITDLVNGEYDIGLGNATTTTVPYPTPPSANLTSNMAQVIQDKADKLMMEAQAEMNLRDMKQIEEDKRLQAKRQAYFYDNRN